MKALHSPGKALCLLIVLTEFIQETSALYKYGNNVQTIVYSYSQRYKSCFILCWYYYLTRYSERYECASGWMSNDGWECNYAYCNGDTNLGNACNTYFSSSHVYYDRSTYQHYSEGSCVSPGSCSCTKSGFYSLGHTCGMCDAISNCDISVCTSTSNEACSRCSGQVSNTRGYRAYVLYSGLCYQACSWRSDSTRCYPGDCSSEYSWTCSCSSGFGGSHCSTITTYPSIYYNYLTISSSSDVRAAPANVNSGPPQGTKWINLANPSSMTFRFDASYSFSAPTRPPYVTAFAVGLTGLRAVITQTRGGSNIRSSTTTCSGYSASAPVSGARTCQSTLTPSSQLSLPLNHLDVITFSLRADNGGYMNLRNLESGGDTTYYYSGKTTTHSFTYTADFVNPYHCYNTASCLASMLDVQDVVTSSASVAWSSWVDDDSGLSTTLVSIYKLVISGNELVKNTRVYYQTLSSNSFSFTPPSAGMYSIIAQVNDVATNYKLTRRVFFYDPTYSISIHTGILRVTTAATNTSWVWQHSLTPVTVDWANRYWNEFHYSNKLYNRVADESGVDSSYDDYEGERTRNSITHIWGILRFSTYYSKDNQGGRTLSNPSQAQYVAESDLDMTRTFNPGVVDGDTIRFWVSSYDIRGAANVYVESIDVHIDTSDPIIENLWLTSNTYTQLYVHDNLDLSTMTIEWDAYDYHSGVSTIYWRLYDNFTGSDLDHGYAQESAQGSTSTLSACNTMYAGYARGASCYCTGPVGCYHKHYQILPNVVSRSATIGGVFSDTQIGVHDYDYWIEVTLTNNANLVTVLTQQITIDNSPPEIGHVYDGPVGTYELDYTTTTNLRAHWDGFFDKESGIAFYQYIFSTSCVGANYFDRHSPNYQVTQTTNTVATYTASASNRMYYVTVVAYNAALGKSDPVCSDGIYVDSPSLTIDNFYVENARIVPGLIIYSNNVYLVEENRMKVRVANPTSACRSKAYTVSLTTLNSIQSRSYDGGTTTFEIDQSVGCTYNGLSSTFLTKYYLIGDGHLYINWTVAEGQSPIFKTEVAIGTGSSSSSTNILGWTDVHNHNEFRHQDLGLNDGSYFYVHIKVTYSSGYIVTRSGIGPGYLHRDTAPSFTGTVSMTLSSNFFVFTWTSTHWSDYERYQLDFKLAIIDVGSGVMMYPYHSPMSGSTCTVVSTSVPTCAAVPISSMNTALHEGHQYRAILQATNYANMTTSVNSATYTYKVITPITGTVYEVVPSSDADLLGISETEDTDYQMSRTTLKARWFGFDTHWYSVTYRVGLGSYAGGTNIRGWRSVSTQTEYTFTGLSLSAHSKYYVYVQATTDVGSVYKSSDGVLIVNNNEGISKTINDGVDCHHQYNDQLAGFSAQHETNAISVSCTSDLTYQPMTYMYGCYWSMTANDRLRYPDIRWRLEHYNSTTEIWEMTRPWELVSGNIVEVIATGLDLTPGETYRSAVRFCVGLACTTTQYSNGVTITPSPPVSGDMVIDHALSGAYSVLTVTFEKFYDPDIANPIEAKGAIAGYQYAITDNTHDSKLFRNWENISPSSINSTFNTVTITIDALDFSVCRTIAIKGYNYVGMSATISAQVVNCSAYDPLLIIPNVVIDAVGEQAGELDYVGDSVVLEKNAEWPTADADYTPFTNVLSAVWPKLRHRNYTYAVIRLTGSWDSTHHDGSNHLSLSDPCNHPNALYCGTTTHEYANIYFAGGSLLNGRRYAVCVHAEATQIVHEKWVEDLAEVGECSDGITVDTSAPNAGRVHVANLRNSMYSPYTNEVTIQWDQFSDVEQATFASHQSGITKYQLALGSIEYGEDVQKFYDIGLINQIKLDNLNLVEGSTYYASIRAFDFTGKYTTVTTTGFVVDNSPPLVTNAQFWFGNKHLTSTSSIEVCWDNMFSDPESGIIYYEWAVGTRPGYANILSYTEEGNTCGSGSVTLLDGKSYYVSVMAYNGAGLYNITTSKPMIVAVNSPSAGVVFDGPSSGRTTTRQDDDFKNSVSTPLEAYWSWFYSPHASITYYSVSLGTCSGCDDVVKDRYVGLRTEIIYDDIELSHGLTYYTTVTACDSMDRCISATSDGILIDVTPPVVGVVQDGVDSQDIEFQGLRDFIGAKWYGFHDAESDLYNYEWSAGTTAENENIQSWTPVGFKEIIYDAFFSPNLPLSTRIYISIRATNRAGLSAVATSNGFIVDSTAPVNDVVPTIADGVGTLDGGSTFMSRDVLRVSWSFYDSESGIEKYFVSLSTEQYNDYHPSQVELPATVTKHTFRSEDMGVSFQDGTDYVVRVMACNLAKLCTTQFSTTKLFDASPPLPGMFAIDTIHTADLTRHRTDYQSYTQSSVSLGWVGFNDIHSGISNYLISVGSHPFGTDHNSGGTYRSVSHVNSGSTYDDEGYIQMATIPTSSLLGRTSIFVAIWAVNGVGLKSQPVHHELYLNGGTLDLRRRCTNYNCQGHCVCAVQDDTCTAASGCTDISGGSPTRDTVTVQDIVDLSFSGGSASYSPSRNYLAAKWSITTTQGLSVLRYEVAVGSSSSSSPSGIYNSATERVWYDVGQMTQAVISLYDRTLTNDQSHSVFVRAWYSSNQYAIFKSPGVTAAHTAISKTITNGIRVKDLFTSSDTKDTDYISVNNLVASSWPNVFQGGTSGIQKYDAFLTRIPGAGIHDSVLSISAPTTVATFSGLSLVEGTRYYTNVVAHNHAGLVAYASSDGFLVDTTNPDNGIVLDGPELHDIDAQSSTTELHAQWKYFADTGSGIRRYKWCIGTNNDASTCNVKSWTDVGLKTHGMSSVSMTPGTTVYNKVKAEDWAGNESPVSVSDGVIIDNTGPAPVANVYLSETELLSNPSFETDPYEWDNTTLCDAGAPTGWTLAASSCSKLQRSDAPIAAHSDQYLLLSGALYQTASVTTGALYRLKIKVGYPQTLEHYHKAMNGYVTLGLEGHTFHLDPDRCQGQCDIDTENSILWYTMYFYHVPESTSLRVTIGTHRETSDMHLALDDVSLIRIYYSRQYVGQPTENYLTHQAMFLPRWSTVNAVWHFEDSESVIVDYAWALGTVPGGTQLQNFKSVGKLNHGVKSDLSLTHNTTLYITVLATNLAGVVTKVEFTPIRVDMTPLIISDLNDGLGVNDLDYQLSYTISANWQVEEMESNADHCDWAIGTSPGDYDVKIFESLSPGVYSASHAVNDVMYPTPYKFFVTVRCYNSLGLFSVAYTNGVTVVSANRTDGIQSLDVLKDSSTYWPVDSQCLNVPNSIRLKWELDQTDSLIKGYKFSILDLSPFPLVEETRNCTGNDTAGNGTSLVGNITNFNVSGNATNVNSTDCTYTVWVSSAPENFTVFDRNTTVDILSANRDFPPFSATLYDIPMGNLSNISVIVTPIDIFDMEQSGTEAIVILDQPGPTVVGSMDTGNLSMASSTNLTLDWTNVFSSYWSDLTYEVTVGSKDGASNIVQWQQTTSTTLTLDMTQTVIKTFNLSVVITAYDACGYFTTYNSGLFQVELPP